MQVSDKRPASKRGLQIKQSKVGLRSQGYRGVEALDRLVQGLSEAIGILLLELLDGLLFRKGTLFKGFVRVSRVLLFICLPRKHVFLGPHQLASLPLRPGLLLLRLGSPLLLLQLVQEHSVTLVSQVVAVVHIVEWYEEYGDEEESLEPPGAQQYGALSW